MMIMDEMIENNFYCQPKRLRKQFRDIYMVTQDSLVAQTVKRLPTMRETQVRSPDWEKPLEEGIGNPLQYSYLENPHGQRGAWRATVHGAAESDTTEWLSTAHMVILSFKYKAYLWYLVITTRDLSSSNKSITRITATPNYRFYSLLHAKYFMLIFSLILTNLWNWNYAPILQMGKEGDDLLLHSLCRADKGRIRIRTHAVWIQRLYF